MRSQHAVLIFLVGAGCASALPKPPKPDAEVVTTQLPHRALGVPGETMEYQVTLRGVTVGRVMVAVGEPGWLDDHHAIIVRSRGTSAGLLSSITDLRWELTSTLDLDTGELLHEVGESTLKFAGKEEHDSYDHDGAGRVNVHTVAAMVRAWKSHVGEHAKMDVTIEHATFDVEIADEARELLGERPAVRYGGIAHGRFPFNVWVSDDASRVPLFLRTESKWGTIEIELVHYDLNP